MAGGTWSTQNKVRPGVYIRFKSNDDYRMTIGERGVVAICMPLDWGPVDKIIEITPDMETTSLIGATIQDTPWLREMFKGTNRTGGPKKVLVFRGYESDGVAATVTTGNLTATAVYSGTAGNNLTIQIIAEADSTFTVKTIYNGVIMDSQNGTTVASLTDNDWVKFTGSGALAATAGAALTGGTNGDTTHVHANFLSVLENYDFDIVAYDGTDNTTRSAYMAFIERMADEIGKYGQLIVVNTTAPDSRFVINLAWSSSYQNVTLEDGTSIKPIYWLAGAEAGAQYNESLTYATYPGAISGPSSPNQTIINAINAGKLVLDTANGAVRVETDINSLHTYTQDIGAVYRKNRVMRLCNSLANDIYQQFADNFIGVVTNNESGRERLKAAIVGYMIQLQRGEGIRDFSPNDVEVLPGESIDAVVINLAFYALDAVEKIYMTVTVS